MDGLSGAASVIAVVQIAVQIGQGISKIQSLLHSINDAPKEIQSVIEELEFFDSILKHIRRNEETFGSKTETYLALSRCDASLKSLLVIAESLVPGFVSSSRIKRKWAAIEVVRKNEEIANFKAKLQEAKLDLLIAQQTSAMHAQYLGHKTHQDSLTTLNQGLADLCERLAYSSNTVTPLSRQDRSIPTEVSAEIHQATSFWGTDGVQSGLEAQLTHVVQNTFTSVLEDQKEKHGTSSATSDMFLIPRARLIGKLSGRRVLHSSSKVTRTMLGEMHCTVTTYQIGGESSRTSDPEKSDKKEELEIETNFSLVPSWWVVKFGMARVFKFDIMQLSSQGWQAKMATFNLVPSNSPIFGFCRDGNLDAVRSLIKHGHASARDITSEGFTPLHAAASSCKADICALLLREGADPGVREHSCFQLTPFEFACLPGDVQDEGHSIFHRRIPGQNLEQTIRTFLKLDDCFDEAFRERIIRNLISCEGKGIFVNLSAKTPGMWLLYEVMPTINPYIIDDRFWQLCLKSTLDSKWGHSTTEALMSHCNEDMIRTAFMSWIHSMKVHGTGGDGDQWSIRDFNLLRERSGGLHFVHRDLYSGNGETSLVFNAMQYSWSFTIFRVVLDRAGIDRQQFIEDQISAFDDGWTVERLLRAFDEPSQTVANYTSFGCDLCRVSVSHPNDCEVPWQRRLKRIKAGLDLDSPLDEDELRDQKEWDMYRVLWKADLCSKCHSQGLKAKGRRWHGSDSDDGSEESSDESDYESANDD